MPVRLYVGPSGSGKTYEVVKNLILPALQQGRRVITNIAGLEYDLMKLYTKKKLPDYDLQKFGILENVDTDTVNHPLFFRHEHDTRDKITSYIQAGDLVCIDEIWRYLPRRGELPERFLNFLKMHRHHVNEQTGFVIDVALISQGVRDFHEQIRDNTQETYSMLKNTAVGSESSYSISIYGAYGKLTKSNLITQLPIQFYDPEICQLYKSQSLGSGKGIKEVRADKRGTIFNSAFFKYLLPIVFVFGVVSLYYVYQFFNDNQLAKKAKANHEKISPKPSAVVASLPNSQGLPSVQTDPQSDKKNQIQQVNKWYVVGYLKMDQSIQFTISDGTSFLYLTDPKHHFVGKNVVVTLPDGSLANSFNKPKNHEIKIM